MTTTFFYFLAFIALLVAGGYTVTRKWDDVPKTALQKKSDDMNLLTQQYNEVIQMMEDSYKHENTSSFRTRKEYSKRYEKVEKEYKQKPLVYTGENFYNSYLVGELDGYKLMIARYSAKEPVLKDGRDIYAWQYTGKGSLEGVVGYVDKSRLMGRHSLREIRFRK